MVIFRQVEKYSDLGGSDTDFGTGVDMNTAVGLARYGTSDGVDNTHAKCAAFHAITHSEDGVGRFTRLRYKDANVITEDRSLAIQEVRGEFDRNWDFGEFLEDGSGLRRSVSL